MQMRSVMLLVLGVLLVGCPHKSAPAAPHVITVATTTSTRDSGLLDVLMPKLEAETGIEAKIVAVGSGQALEIGRRGDADALLVHSPDAEEKLMAEGHGASRQPVMYNDFVVVGPRADPAHVSSMKEAAAAFVAIASSRTTFVSRGDQSGTHAKEQQLWKVAKTTPQGDWYKSAGQGMAEVLRMANQMGAYTLADRATYLSQRKNIDLVVVLEKDPALLNPYSVIVIDAKKHPTVHADDARRFAEFLVAPETQKVIAAFNVTRDGEPSFFVYPK